MTMEQRIKSAFGEQVFSILLLQQNLEDAKKQISDLESKQDSIPQKPSED